MTELPERTLNAVTKGGEGITTTDTGMIFADGEDAVSLVALIACRSALRFEVETGMKMTRVSALAAANRMLGTNYRRKAQALAHMDGLLTAYNTEGDES